jgi:hypothetical protein
MDPLPLKPSWEELGVFCVNLGRGLYLGSMDDGFVFLGLNDTVSDPLSLLVEFFPPPPNRSDDLWVVCFNLCFFEDGRSSALCGSAGGKIGLVSSSMIWLVETSARDWETVMLMGVIHLGGVTMMPNPLSIAPSSMCHIGYPIDTGSIKFLHGLPLSCPTLS